LLNNIDNNTGTPCTSQSGAFNHSNFFNITFDNKL